MLERTKRRLRAGDLVMHKNILSTVVRRRGEKIWLWQNGVQISTTETLLHREGL